MNKIKPIMVNFLESPDEEVSALLNDMRLLQIARYIQSTDEPIPSELRELLQNLLTVIADTFSIDLPGLQTDPEVTLRAVAREINIARLLRERGIFRFFRLLYTTDNGIPWYMKRINPFTGNPFTTQDEFIGWFCADTKTSRALVFMRIATISRMLSLGIPLEDAFRMMVTKPYAIQETLRMVADWGKGGVIENIDPQVAALVSKRYIPEVVAGLEDFDQEKLVEVVKPGFVKLLEEVSDHERARDALDFVRHDILKQPEIHYYWEEDGYILIEMIVRSVDENGLEYTAKVENIPLVPDTPFLPDEVKNDLLKRLPIRNRTSIDK